MRAILNASPIIAVLDELCVPKIFLLLRQIGWDLEVPEYVSHQEIVKPPGAQALRELIDNGILTEIADPPAALISGFVDENPDLEWGESCVVLSCANLIERGSDVIAVLDDGPARTKAQGMGIPLIGTLGLIGLLEKRNLVSKEEASRLRRLLGSSTFRASTALLRDPEDRVN